MCEHRQCSSLVPIVMRARSCSDVGNCPTSSPCELDVVLWLELSGPGTCVCPGAMFPIFIGSALDVLFLMKARTFSSKLWGQLLSTSTRVSIALR